MTCEHFDAAMPQPIEFRVKRAATVRERVTQTTLIRRARFLTGAAREFRFEKGRARRADVTQ